MIDTESQIKHQAERDAVDAYAGYRVWCPYPLGDERADIWRDAFDRQMELLVMEDKR